MASFSPLRGTSGRPFSSNPWLQGGHQSGQSFTTLWSAWNCSIEKLIAFCDPKTHQVEQCTCSAVVIYFSGKWQGGNKKRVSQICYLNNESRIASWCCVISTLEEFKKITGLHKPQLNFFQLLQRCTDLLASTRLPADKYEANIKSVANCIKSSVDEVKESVKRKTSRMVEMELYLPVSLLCSNSFWWCPEVEYQHLIGE